MLYLKFCPSVSRANYSTASRRQIEIDFPAQIRQSQNARRLEEKSNGQDGQHPQVSSNLYRETASTRYEDTLRGATRVERMS